MYANSVVRCACAAYSADKTLRGAALYCLHPKGFSKAAASRKKSVAAFEALEINLVCGGGGAGKALLVELERAAAARGVPVLLLHSLGYTAAADKRQCMAVQRELAKRPDAIALPDGVFSLDNYYRRFGFVPEKGAGNVADGWPMRKTLSL